MKQLNTVQRLVKNMLSLLLSKIVAQLFAFIVMIYLARVLGPEAFGKINFAIAMVAFFMLIPNLGLPIVGTREIARNKGKTNYYIGNIVSLQISLAVFGFALLCLSIYFLNKPNDIKYLVLLYGLGLFSFAIFLEWVFQGIEKMEHIGLARLVSSMLYLISVIWFVNNSEQLLLIPCFQFIGNIVGAGLLFFMFFRTFGKSKIEFDFTSWKNLLKQSFPIGLAIIMAPIILYTDTIMLSFMRSNEEVGYYNAANKIITTLTLLSVVYQDAIFPILSNYYNTSLNLLRKIECQSAKLVICLALPLALGGSILAKPIINLLFGHNYDPGIIAFQILIWSFALESIYHVPARGLIACNKERERLKVITVIAITNLVMNFILIPFLGLKGAAMATLLARFVGLILFYKAFNNIIVIPIHHYILKPFIASCIMCFLIYYCYHVLHLHLFLLIFIGTSIYFSSFYVMKGFDRKEIIMLLQKE